MQKFTGKEYLQIDIANHYGHGLDKGLFKDRIAWVNAGESILEQLTDQADDYFQYASAVMAYRKAQKGTATGYMVGMDATASGIQLLSTIIGCKIGAVNSGITGNKRVDPYKTATDIMNNILDTSTAYDRSIVKKALMT